MNLAVLLMLLAGLAVLILFLAYLIQGAPYVASKDQDAEKILEIARKYKPKRVLDMGSGNGKLVILLARHGYQADGIELNPMLVWQSRRTIKKLGLHDKARIRWGNFWRYDTSGYDVVILYAIQHIMPKLERKLRGELPVDAYIVSNYFTFPQIKPIKQTGRLRVYKM